MYPEPMREPLTAREVEVLQLAALGHSNARIAATLFITIGTVKNHLTHIYAKLGVRSRTQASLRVWRQGLADPFHPPSKAGE